MPFSKFKSPEGKAVRVDLSKASAFFDNGSGTTIVLDNGSSVAVADSVITVNNRANSGAEVAEPAAAE